MIDILFHLHRETGTTLLLITHDAALADRCERTLALEDGRLVAAVAA